MENSNIEEAEPHALIQAREPLADEMTDLAVAVQIAREERAERDAAFAENAELRGAIETLRQDVARGISTLRDFKEMVRSTVIEKIREGTICRDGSNEVLEQWGLEPYDPRWRVNLRLDVIVELEADDEADASYMARQSVTPQGDDDVSYVELDDVTVLSVREADDPY